jgi:hypothetical protein
MPRLIVFALLFCFGLVTVFAQDTAKKKPPVQAAPKYSYRRHSYGYYKRKADSTAHAPVQPTQTNQTNQIKTDSVVPVQTNQSLNSQYQYLMTQIYHYQQPLISALWKNASDTLNANRAKLRAALAKIGDQNKAADSLKTVLNDQDTELASKDGIDIFGIILPKTTYNLIVWGLVAIFGIIAFAVIARSAGYRREARHRTQLYTELEEEYKAFKVKANDKEKKLARELQTERNKLDDLLGRG